MAEQDGLNITQGINEGSAQVADFQPSPYWAKGAEIKLGNKKEEEKRLQGVYGNLKSLNKLDVLPRDLPHFQQVGSDLRDYIYKNTDKIRKGDPSAMMEIQTKLADFENKAQLAKNFKKQVEGIGTKLMEKEFTPESEDYFHSLVNNPEGVNYDNPQEAWSIDPTKFNKLKKDFDVNKFKKEVQESHHPDKKITSTFDPATGLREEKENQYFRNPDLLAKDAMSNKEYNNHIVNEYNLLSPQEQKKYSEKARKSGSGSAYQEYAKEDLLGSYGLTNTEKEGGTKDKDANKVNTAVTYDVTKNGDKVINFSSVNEKGEKIESKPLQFILNDNSVVNAIPIKWVRKGQGAPKLLVSTKDADTDEYKTQEIPYDIASPIIQNEYGFNFEDIEQGNKLPKNIKINDFTKSQEKNIPTHSEDEFKSAGWTDAQIKKAIELGKIKIK